MGNDRERLERMGFRPAKKRTSSLMGNEQEFYDQANTIRKFLEQAHESPLLSDSMVQSLAASTMLVKAQIALAGARLGDKKRDVSALFAKIEQETEAEWEAIVRSVREL